MKVDNKLADKLIEAIKVGQGIDYIWDGENEKPVDTFDPCLALQEVIKVLEKYEPEK